PQARQHAEATGERGRRGQPSQRGHRPGRRATAERPLECRHREQAQVDQGDPAEDGTAGLRRTRLAALDHPLIPRRVEQLDAALGTEDEQEDGVTAGPHDVSRIRASSIESPGPKAMASTSPEDRAFCRASNTKKIPALETFSPT